VRQQNDPVHPLHDPLISRARLCFWRNSKTGWGSHDSIPCTTTRQYNE